MPARLDFFRQIKMSNKYILYNVLAGMKILYSRNPQACVMRQTGEGNLSLFLQQFASVDYEIHFYTIISIDLHVKKIGSIKILSFTIILSKNMC